LITVDHTADLAPFVSQELGVSEWITIDEESIKSFGRITGDTHWVHMDAEKARRETPFGGIIAHGFLVLAIITGLSGQCYAVRSARRWLNYGLDRVRFTAVVAAGSRLRLRLTLLALEPQKSGTRLRLGCAIELDASERPAAVCEWICIAFEENEK
jgi:acyl dehydratase